MSVRLENVSVVSGDDTIIDSVSLELVRGGMNILLGPTLSGKTTLMRLMAGLDKPTGGRVWAAGRDVTGVAVQKRSVAMVYQQFINYPSLTVFENIASPLRSQGSPPPISRRGCEAPRRCWGLNRSSSACPRNFRAASSNEPRSPAPS